MYEYIEWVKGILDSTKIVFYVELGVSDIYPYMYVYLLDISRSVFRRPSICSVIYMRTADTKIQRGAAWYFTSFWTRNLHIVYILSSHSQ